jgi:hypothetical protein
VLAFTTQVRGFKPSRSSQILKGEKILSTPSFGGEVTLSVPCHRFTACKRTLKCNVEVDILGKITSYFITPKISTFRCLDLSRLVGRADIWRRKWERLEQHRASTISLRAAVHPAHMLRALITKDDDVCVCMYVCMYLCVCIRICNSKDKN